MRDDGIMSSMRDEGNVGGRPGEPGPPQTRAARMTDGERTRFILSGKPSLRSLRLCVSHSLGADSVAAGRAEIRHHRACPGISPIRHFTGNSQSQGNGCQGNGKQPFQIDSPDNHSPDISPAFSIRLLLLTPTPKSALNRRKQRQQRKIPSVSSVPSCSTILHLHLSVSICVNLWPSLACLSIREIREIRGHSPPLSATKLRRAGGQFLPGYQAKALSKTASLDMYLHFV